MRKNNCLFTLVLVLLSCNKLHDFFPPLPSAPQFNKVYGEPVHDQITALTRSMDDGYILTGYTISERMKMIHQP